MNRSRLIPFALATLLLAGCNGHGEHFTLITANTTSIDNDAIRVAHDRVTLNPDNGTSATIASNGDFAVDGKPVTVTPEEHALLMQYFGAATAIREHGIETGIAGAGIAGAALKSAATSLFGDDDKSADAKVQIQSDKVKQAAMKICDDMAAIRSAQDQLASQLPAFGPYAHLITAGSVESCRKDDND